MIEFIKKIWEGTTTGPYQALIDRVIGYMQFSTGVGGVSTAHIIAVIFNLVKPAAMGFIIAFSLYELLESVIKMGDNITLNVLIPPLLKCALCYAFLSISGQFIGNTFEALPIIY